MLILDNDSISCIGFVISLDPNVLTARMKHQEMCSEESENSLWKLRNQRMSDSKIILDNDSMLVFEL